MFDRKGEGKKQTTETVLAGVQGTHLTNATFYFHLFCSDIHLFFCLQAYAQFLGIVLQRQVSVREQVTWVRPMYLLTFSDKKIMSPSCVTTAINPSKAFRYKLSICWSASSSFSLSAHTEKKKKRKHHLNIFSTLASLFSTISCNNKATKYFSVRISFL